jgi:GTP-binding protein
MKETQHIATVGHVSQFKELLNGEYLHGYAEPRVAMVGRSNVGKSSLLNLFLKQKLAHVSKTPGKTRHIHFYGSKELNLVFADLPGYGFAKVSKEERQQWNRFIEAYLSADVRLALVLVLLDGRHDIMDRDREAISFVQSLGRPFACVFTKWDQLKTQASRAQKKKDVEAYFKKEGWDLKNAFFVSSETKFGVSELIRGLREIGA